MEPGLSSGALRLRRLPGRLLLSEPDTIQQQRVLVPVFTYSMPRVLESVAGDGGK